MCYVDWSMLLKVLFSWPPVALVISVLLVARFRSAIDDFLKRIVEGNIFGQVFKAVPPLQQSGSTGATQDKLTIAAETAPQTTGGHQIEQQDALPPELAGDPQAPAAVAYVRANPGQTFIEYKKLLFAYNSERLFVRIFGTQIELLEFLAARPETPAPLPLLTQFLDEHHKKSNSTEYQLRDYVNFLISFGVISVSGPENSFEYQITQHGVEFLSYIKSNYPTGWKDRAF